MPEGDTVWQAARMLESVLVNTELVATEFRVPQHATVDLAGGRVRSVTSRGKHLLIRVGLIHEAAAVGDVVLHTHLKMEGAWHIYRPAERWRRPGHTARVVLRTAEHTIVGFSLGIVEIFPAAEEAARLGYLGPDLLGSDWDAAAAIRRLAAHPTVPVVVALADQRNLAGLGNVYVNELCFLRGLHPGTPVREVDLAPLVGLANRVITANRDRPARTTTGIDQSGKRLWVYGRAGQPCRRCGTPIVRGQYGRNELELRETCWCPHCQI